MPRYLRLLRLFLRTELQYALAYRANLAVELLQMVVIILTSIGAVLVLFSYTSYLNGWSLAQMLVLLGVYYIVQGFSDVAFQPSMEKLMEHVRMGTLDFALLKPVNSQFMVSLRHLQVPSIAECLLGFVVVGIGVARIGQAVPLLDALAFALTLICGLVLVYTLLLVLATTSFWFVRTENILAIFWAFLDAGRFPVEIYPGWLRVTMSTVVPIGVAVTIPAQTLSGRSDPLAVALLVGGTILAFLFAGWFWRVGVKSYTGASA